MWNQGFHLLPFYTAALTDPSTNASLGAVTDPVFPIQSSKYLPGQDYYAMVAYVGTVGITSARINQPSQLLPFYPQLDPLSATVLPANLPPLHRFGSGGLLITATESLALEVSETGGGGTIAVGGLWLAPRPWVYAPGQVRTLLATATITCSAGTWVQGNLTLTSTLQAGTYQVVGMSAYGTNLLFARLSFSNQVLRPGVLAQAAVGEWNDETWRRGNAGVWGTFTNTTIPIVECLSVGACTAQTFLIDVIKVG